MRMNFIYYLKTIPKILFLPLIIINDWNDTTYNLSIKLSPHTSLLGQYDFDNFSQPKKKKSNIAPDTYHIILYGHIPLNKYYNLKFWRQ